MTTTHAPNTYDAGQSAPAYRRSRLTGLDGIRGLAALFVVADHTYLRSFPGFPRITAPWWAGWFIYGRFAVVVFIVLSGFSLSVSPARHGYQLGGVGRFAQRRIWRIIPPYWAALTLSLLVAWFIVPQPGQAAPTAKSAVVNGLLVQDAFTAPSPNRAFWTIAIEAQLYVALPLLLLMVRRVNAFAMLAAVLAVLLPVGVLLSPVTLIYYAPDFAGLFAIGVAAAGVVAAGDRVQAMPWHWFAALAAAPGLIMTFWMGSVWTLSNLFWVDLSFGPAIGCLLVAVATGRPRPLVGLLDTRPVRRLGTFSYSLYLTHAPIVVIVYELIVAGRVRQGVPSFLVSMAITLPIAIIFAGLFGAVFEIPFQRHRSWPALRAAVYAKARPALAAVRRHWSTVDSQPAAVNQLNAPSVSVHDP